MRKQKGISLSGLLVISFLLVLGAIFSFKLIPPYMNYFAVQKILTEIAHDPEMKGAPAAAIKTSFAKRAQINNVGGITGEDMDISQDSISASWSVKVPVAGNVSACIDFEAVAAR